MLSRRCALLALAAVALAIPARAADPAADLTAGLKTGNPELKSAGALAFGPQGMLFVGDSSAATIYAIATGDTKAADSTARPKVDGIDDKIASMLGIEAKGLQIKDLAVNPISGTTYLAVARGGPTAAAVLVRVSRDGKLSEFALKGVKFSQATLPNAPKSTKQEAITHLAYVKGRVLVAGLSNEEFSSKLRSIPFPFTKADEGTSVEIFHGAHGRFETNSPVRTFVPYEILGESNVLAAYQCTPLVKIPLSDLKPGAKVKGTTVAELGNRNRPLSMIVYQKGGKDYVLMANSSRGLMKIPLEGVEKIKGITSRVKDKAGLTYDTVESLKGVHLLDRFDKDHALVLLNAGGAFNLQTVELP